MRQPVPADGLCTVEKCEEPHLARGWCSVHWQRNKHHGSPTYEPPTEEERFWAQVDKDGPGGCWLWLGSINSGGYGEFHHDYGCSRAHRWAYEHLVGPITEETLDHLCRVRPCVNPQHLDPCSRGENTMRGHTITAAHAAKTHCLRGHPLSGTNVYRYRGNRHCRACRAMHDRKHKARTA